MKICVKKGEDFFPCPEIGQRTISKELRALRGKLSPAGSLAHLCDKGQPHPGL